jgi:HNH endonuclease/PBCV-specific basic adaptor protein
MRKYILFLIISFLLSLPSFSQETYKIGNTEYYYGEYYSTTGKPLVKRSGTNKRNFLYSLGYSEIPKGYEIDHIIPLSEGGTDDPSNMQLLTIEQHKRKTALERSSRSNSIYSTQRTLTNSSTYNRQFYNNNTTSSSTYLRTDSNGRTLYKGSRGGEYYVNSNGNKVYVNSKKKSTPNYYSTPRGSSNRVIQTGPRGGKYYINSKGNKTYVKKKN